MIFALRSRISRYVTLVDLVIFRYTHLRLGLISRFGQFYKSVDPGLVQVNVCSESIRVVGELRALALLWILLTDLSRCQDPAHLRSEADGADQG